MEETTPLAVCKHIRENVDVSKLLFKGCHFNAIVNNADFFSGHIYSDGGSVYWGTIQQRTDSINNCQLYKYFSYGGADSVIPFKKGYENTPATAVAADITEGKTAWVNGELVTGTRPAPINYLSGSKSQNIANGASVTWTFKFSTPFDSIPKVSWTANFTLSGGNVYNVSKTGFSFTGTLRSGSWSSSEYVTFSWTATV